MTVDMSSDLIQENEIDFASNLDQGIGSEAQINRSERIIKSGSIEFKVSEINDSKEKVDLLINRFKSYYENESFNSYRNHLSFSLMIRIPNAQFDSLVHELENGIGTIQMKNIRANDVTEEYVDLQIRLENALTYVNQYKEILKKAKSIKEILEVKEIIRQTEVNIERNKGRLKYLDNKVKYSTLNVELKQILDTDYSNEPTFNKRLSSAFKGGIQGFQTFLVFVVGLWPFILLLILFVVFRKNLKPHFNWRGKK